MQHGSLKIFDNNTEKWEGVDADAPMPTCALGEAVEVTAKASVNSYALIAESVLDTQTDAHLNIAYQCVVDTADVTLKCVASLDGDDWYDLPNLADETGTPRSGEGPVTEVTTSLGMDVTAAVVFLIPSASPLSAFRYFGIMHKSAVTDTPGNTTVSAFSK